MPLSWNEIRSRSIRFSKEWENVITEDAEAKSFLDQFFEVFGISRRRVASFEHRVKKIDNKSGYIDMLWKGQILIEMKSGGADLDKAYKQATDYFPGLIDAELPHCILVCDFRRFRLYDLDDNSVVEFKLTDLHKNVRHFGFLIGLELKKFEEQSPVNIKAAEKIGMLHDQLEAVGYKGHNLELYLVRLVFCLFADDTGIFDKGIFFDYIRNRTSEDGRNLASAIAELFYILNTPTKDRLSNIDEDINQFPYVNGKLFEENASITSNRNNYMNEDTFLRVASELLEERWIPVSERLPESNARVQVTDGFMTCEANLNSRNGNWEGWRTINEEYLNTITHWKPLSQPPNN